MATQEDIQQVAVPTEVPTSSEHDWVMRDGKIVTVGLTWCWFNGSD